MYLLLLFCWKQGVASQQTAGEGAGVFGRFRFLNQRASSQGEDSLSCHTIDLRTSTIKVDADENDLRFCFRIISPIKTFTLQVTALLVFSCWTLCSACFRYFRNKWITFSLYIFFSYFFDTGMPQVWTVFAFFMAGRIRGWSKGLDPENYWSYCITTKFTIPTAGLVQSLLMHHITSLCLPFWLKPKDRFIKLHAPTLANDVINKVIMLGCLVWLHFTVFYMYMHMFNLLIIQDTVLILSFWVHLISAIVQ